MLQFVYVSIDTRFRDHSFYDCCKFSKKFFFYRRVNTKRPNFVSFLVFVGAAASSTAKISSFETVAKREAILNTVPTPSEYPRIFPVTGANQNARKLIVTDLVNTKTLISLIKF